MVEPADFKYVVSGLRTHAAYVQAIDVMDAGKKRWAKDSTIDELVEALGRTRCPATRTAWPR